MTTSAQPAGRGGGLRYLIIISASLGAVALFLLATASANTALFAEHYSLLLLLNGGIALMLAGIVGYQLVSLRRKLRAGVFGSKLTLRLVLLFALIAVIPGTLMYGVSVQFLAKSIESWFEVRIDKALEGGLNLGRGALDGMLRDVGAKADAISLALSTRPPAEHLAALHTLREQTGLQEAALYTQAGKLLAVSGQGQLDFVPEAPTGAALRQARLQQGYRAIEAIPDKGLFLRVLVPVSSVSIAEESRILQALEQVPRQLARDAETVQAGYREYQELTLARRGLKRLYGITLTLTLLLALLASLALAFLLSDRLSAPLGVLVEGTRAVAQGDFTRRAQVESRDELGILTQSFNSMTLQLADARAQAERNQEQVAHAKAYLESILANLSAGVLAFDGRLALRSANPSAGQILGIECAPLIGCDAAQWGGHDASLAAFGGHIAGAFAGAESGEWEQQVERETKAGTQVLLLRGTRLPPGAEAGFLVVFDDVTHLLQAQRDAAWAEVARRLAHEIKNPLTPIQLSAERLEAKLASRLAGADADMLVRSTRTIISQVSALKRMVDAFSEYARTPEPAMREIDFNALVREVLALYESFGSTMRIELAPQLPAVVGDPGQLRQVIHNLVQNAQDALAETSNPRIVIATTVHGGTLELSVTDNGSGFAEQLMKRVFEPYVTTKSRGTGLGLAIVKKIVEEHGGTVSIANIAPHGARVTVELPVPAPIRRRQAGRQTAV